VHFTEGVCGARDEREGRGEQEKMRKRPKKRGNRSGVK